MLKNPVGWFEIYVADLSRAKIFYEAVFGHTLTPMPNDGSFQALMFQGEMPGTGAMGALIQHPMKKPSTDGTMVYFSCADCTTQIKKTLENGGSVFRDKHHIGNAGYIAIIGDTEGNAIGLHSFT